MGIHIYHRAPSVARGEDAYALVMTSLGRRPKGAAPFAEVVQPHGDGQAVLCRSADDFVCAFQYKRDAERFSRVLGTRLEKYGLERAPEKTRLRRCSRYQKDAKSRFDGLMTRFGNY